ncbi:type IV pilus biogenesis/stability protein PilW [Alkalilimnicola ehrlichii]|uniref:Type IV pilus biogenesis/stability protein PilW n=1 Tax=Alkalilimnicola ehrlichii TaxID=351052 RepID=A0A3E0X1G5_9GAMM|nr:type IV pilus biogenesis/stability protein PilW [Alkalilimnicola ehrlichii]RFA30546.1 type IV pilus biogenesis/stability protein PilW [Alkalilimnicola ehrlichii]RFA38095.1 type IV pilus biogenesis/stability protein PilW [Alkalilimnicola ehrlichii]
MTRILAVVMPLAFALLVSGCATSGTDRPQSADQRASRINTQLGVEYMRQGELEQAKEKLQRAVAQDARYADAHATLALLYDRLNEHNDARRHYRRAVQLAPEDSSILNNYGRFLCAQGNISQAERHFLRAVENPLYRTPEVPYTNLGLCLIRDDRPEEAEASFLKALEANPRFAPALLRVAELRLEGGHAMSARGFYQRYLDVAPQTAETLWLGINIERALGDEDAVASYSLSLRSRFPDSTEARKLLEMERHD